MRLDTVITGSATPQTTLAVRLTLPGPPIRSIRSWAEFIEIRDRWDWKADAEDAVTPSVLVSGPRLRQGPGSRRGVTSTRWCRRAEAGHATSIVASTVPPAFSWLRKRLPFAQCVMPTL